MALGDLVGRIFYRTEIDPTGVSQGAAEAEREVRVSMARIDAMRAEAEIGANSRELDRKLVEARRELLDLEKSKAEPDFGADTEEFDRKYEETKLKVRELSQRKAEVSIQFKNARALSNDLRNVTREQDRAAQAIARSSDAAVDNDAKIARLRLRYAQLRGELQRLGKPGGFGFLSGRNQLKARAVETELARVASQVRRLGSDVHDTDVDLDDQDNTLHRWASSLANVRLHLGFTSLTVKQFGLAVTLLGPIIVGLIGAASALVGVVGTGLAGALSVGIGAAGGFGLSMIGIIAIAKPLVKELTDARKASMSYADAVRKYGEGSSQAKDKLEQLNNTLGNVSPRTRQAFKDFGDLNSQWQKLTQGARRPFFDTIAEGLRTAHALLPMFARESTATFKVAAQGVQQWMQQLRSPGARSAIQDMMSGFRRSLPAIMAGLSNIGAMLGHIGQSASHFLPGLSRGFEEWTRNLEESVGSGASLDSKMGRLIGHMRDLGHLAQSAGRLMVTFFNTGADSGDDMVRSLTRTLDRWNEFLKSTEGQKGLKSFFDDSARSTGHLMTALAQVGTVLFQLSRATAPISDALLKLLTVIGDVVEGLMSFGPTAAVLRTVGAVLASYFVASRIVAFAEAVKLAVLSMRGLAGAQAAMTGAGALGGVFAPGALGGIGGTVRNTTVEMSRMQRVGMGLSGFMGGPLVGALTLAGTALILFGTKTSSINDKIAETKRLMAAASAAADGLASATDDLSASRDAEKESTQSVNEAEKRLAALRKAGKGNTDAAKAAERDLTDARNRQADAMDASAKAEKRYERQRTSTMEKAKAAVDKAKEGVDQYKASILKNLGASRSFAAAQQGINQAALHATPAWKNLQDALERQRIVQARVALDAINLQRHTAGAAKIAQVAARQYANLQRTVGKTTAKHIALKVDDTQALQQISRLSGRLDRAGQGDVVKNILVNAKGDDQAINALQTLNRINLRQKVLEIRESGGSKVLGVLGNIIGRRLPGKTQALGERGGRSILGTLGQIAGITLGPKVQQVIPSGASLVLGILTAIFALPSQKDVNVVTHYSHTGNPGGAEGGRSDRLPILPVHRGGRVNRMGYVVGEEAPRHREWVIAENPAYARANEAYLAAAADALGYMTVPAFRRGGRRGGRPGRPRPGRLPRKPHGHHPRDKGGPHVTGQGAQPGQDALFHSPEYDYWSAMQQHWDTTYSEERGREELFLDPDATGIPALNYGLLEGYLGSEKDAYSKMQGALSSMIANAVQQRGAAIKRGNKAGDVRIASLKDKLAAAEAKRHHMRSPAEAGDAAAKNAKAGHKEEARRDAIRDQKQKLRDQDDEVKRLKDALDQAQHDRTAAVSGANQQVADLNRQIGEWLRERDISIPDAKTSVQNEIDALIAQSQGKINAVPTAEGGAGGGGATPGMEAVTTNAARLELFRSMGSNVVQTGGISAGALGGSGVGITPAGAVAAAFQAVASPQYNPAGLNIRPGLSGGPNVPGPPAGGGVNITNNFAAPPPDAHTWTQQQAFELAAQGA